MTSAAIQARNLSKQYSLGTSGDQHTTLRDLLADSLSRLVGRGNRTTRRKEAFWALRDVTFDIDAGENLGIIGLNGAGKSTLLKVLSRITEPTRGMARITGRVGALLEVGTGFHWELTGRENVYLYGSILGMSKVEISRKFGAIAAFAGIESFLDTPVKRYSSGMYVRLAFAVAAHLEPEILLIDEVLAVGDLPFQRKCMEFSKKLQKGNATILFVSHNMFNIKAMCKRVIYLRQGQIVFDGPTDEGIKLYEEDCGLSTLSFMELKREEWPINITGFSVCDENGRTKKIFDHGERMCIRLTYETRQPLESPNFIIAFIRSDGVACCNYSTEVDGIVFNRVDGTGMVELLTPPLKLVAELYTIHVLVWAKSFQNLLCAQIGSTFHVRDPLLDTHFGVFHEQGEWRFEHS